MLLGLQLVVFAARAQEASVSSFGRRALACVEYFGRAIGSSVPVSSKTRAKDGSGVVVSPLPDLVHVEIPLGLLVLDQVA